MTPVEGRPGSSEPNVVGRVLSAHGVSGEVNVEVQSDVPGRFNPGQVLHIQGNPFRITESRQTRSDRVILKFHGLNARVAAQRLVGQWVTVPQTASPELPPGEYFHFQILGLLVFTEEGEELGQVTEILKTGSNDVYVVSGESGEILVPGLAEVIREIDLAQGRMVVRLMEGLR